MVSAMQCLLIKKERLQEQKITALPGLDETGKWCNGFVIVSKPNGAVHLCINPTQFNQASVRSLHIGQTINDIFPKLTNVHYLTLINVSSDYHNLKLNKNHFCNIFTCPF